MDSDDYEIDVSDIKCAKCGHHPLNFRSCTAIGCEDGWVDEAEFDCVNFAEGEELMPCEECFEGIQRWCPKCGWSWDSAIKAKEVDDGRDDEN